MLLKFIMVGFEIQEMLLVTKSQLDPWLNRHILPRRWQTSQWRWQVRDLVESGSVKQATTDSKFTSFTDKTHMKQR